MMSLRHRERQVFKRLIMPNHTCTWWHDINLLKPIGPMASRLLIVQSGLGTRQICKLITPVYLT